jgi:large subunit ribosomal protein L33
MHRSAQGRQIPSRYTTTRNKKLKTEKLEIKKYNPALRRHTVHREVK